MSGPPAARRLPGMVEVRTYDADGGELILGASGVTTLADGSVIVADKLDYAVKKFSRTGKFLRRAGGRGTGPGQFRGPGPCSSWRNVVAVADFLQARVLLFDSDLRYRASIETPGPVVDVKFDAGGSIWISTCGPALGADLYQLEIAGRVRRVIPLKNTSRNVFDNVALFTIGPKGIIAAAYLTRNILEFWDTSGTFIRELTLTGLPAKSPRVTEWTEERQRTQTIPEGEVIRSLTMDREGNLLVLCGSFTEHPDRDVIVLNSDGASVGRFVLCARSFMIGAGSKGYLYSIEQERTIVRQYLLDYGVRRRTNSHRR